MTAVPTRIFAPAITATLGHGGSCSLRLLITVVFNHSDPQSMLLRWQASLRERALPRVGSRVEALSTLTVSKWSAGRIGSVISLQESVHHRPAGIEREA